MSAYLVFNYAITDPEGYGAYPPAAFATMNGHEIEILVADYQSESKEGAAGEVTVVLRFPSKEAALGWYDSDGYGAVKHLRTSNSTGITVLCDAFTPPS
ncbi:MAG TPA: DUF1330 domain-containing protein [Mycobacteriales bacterium]|jgi:uncharacterized protein (DUF1330 family)|nr:DUF1330 domain-containing protein [Mycobacteriales bacterium]